MPWWYRRALVVWLGCALPVAFAACAGKSSNDPGGEGEKGGSSTTGGAASTGGSTALGCTYNGVHYERGQSFGECNECVCDAKSGVICKAIGCIPGTGGVGNSAGGASGSAGANGSAAAGSTGSSGGSFGCEFGGKHFDEGASWQEECNTCYCKASQASCTKQACPSGTGGTSAGGSAGAAAAGAGGNAQCTYAPIGSFCVLGKPSGDGQDLVEGMPLTVSMRPAGCYSSSCTKLVSADCNYIGSDGFYSISGFVCLRTEGGGCTADCGGGGNPVCEPGVTLAAGDYTVGIGGTALAVKFSVPSHVASSKLCASTGDI